MISRTVALPQAWRTGLEPLASRKGISTEATVYRTTYGPPFAMIMKTNIPIPYILFLFSPPPSPPLPHRVTVSLPPLPAPSPPRPSLLPHCQETTRQVIFNPDRAGPGRKVSNFDRAGPRPGRKILNFNRAGSGRQ